MGDLVMIFIRKTFFKLLLCLLIPLIGAAYNPEGKIKITSYNILANSYIYKLLPFPLNTDYIQWDKRKLLLRQKLINLNSDIFCLQEVEEVEMLDFLVNALKDKGYDFIYSRYKDKSDGLLTFYKRDKLVIISHQVIPLRNSSYIAQHFLFKLKNNSTIFNVVNIKIKWVPEILQKKVYPGYEQIKRLLELDYFRKMEKIILLGDFNCLEDSITYRFIIGYGFLDTFKNNSYPTINANNKLQRVDYLFLKGFTNSFSVQENNLERDVILPNVIEPSDHLQLTTWVDM